MKNNHITQSHFYIPRDSAAQNHSPFEKGRSPLSRKVASTRFALKTGCVTVAILIISITTFAQPSGFAGSFSRLGFGPRGMAMGNALTATEVQGIYGYYNPALAVHAHAGNQVDISTSIMSFDRTLHSLSGTFILPPSAGINIALLNANITDIDGRTTSGYYTSDLATHEYQLMTAFGVNIHQKVAAGIGVKINLADYHSGLANAQGVGFDIGILYKVRDNISLGITAQDLLSSYSWNSGELYGDESSGESTDNFPARFTLGGSCHIQPGVLIAVSYGWLVHKSQTFQQIRLGGSWQIHERISLRAGWQFDDLEHIAISNRPGTGFSVHLPFDILAPSIDYAFVLEPNQISSMHVFGVRLNL